MITEAQKRLGWIQAFFTVLVLWAIMNIALTYSSQVLKVNYIIYTCFAFASSAFVLLAFSGRGKLAKETFRSFDTWAYGFILLLNYMVMLGIFSYVTSTEGSLLQRTNLIFSLIASKIIFDRSSNKWQIIGAVFVMIGIILVCIDLPKEIRGAVYMLMVLEGLTSVARSFIAENHRTHKYAMTIDNDPKARARVIGCIMLVISIIFLIVLLIFAGLQSFGSKDLNIPLLPTLNDFTHVPSIVSGILIGALIMAPIRLLEFSSTYLIKTENFLAVGVLASVATLFWEWLLQPLTGIDVRGISANDIVAMVFITLGALIATLFTMKNKPNNKEAILSEYLKHETQDIANVEDTHGLVTSTLEHYSGDIKISAKALSIPQAVMSAIVDDKNKIKSFTPEAMRDVSRNYCRRVATADALTGLLNRSGFMGALKNAPYEADIFSVLFIDLNKFKPVNDTYGHEVGDKILKGVAERLRNFRKKRVINTRLGGDEFCVLLFDKDKQTAQKYIKELQELIELPFKIPGVKKKIEISASIGIASYPEDTNNSEELVAIADDSMYKDKNSRKK